jgi:hypothetical protein
LISKYFIKERIVKVLADLTSMPTLNKSFLEGLFVLPQLIFENLNDKEQLEFLVINPSNHQVEDVLQIETVMRNREFKLQYLKDAHR